MHTACQGLWAKQYVLELLPLGCELSLNLCKGCFSSMQGLPLGLHNFDHAAIHIQGTHPQTHALGGIALLRNLQAELIFGAAVGMATSIISWRDMRMLTV